MVLVKIKARSVRRESYDSYQNFILQWRELDFHEEKRRDLQLWVAAYQYRMLGTSIRSEDKKVPSGRPYVEESFA